MISSKIRNREKLQTRRKIADYMIAGAIPWYGYVEGHSRSVAKGMHLEFMRSMAFLARRGCDLRSLHVMLDMGRALMSQVGRYSVPKTKTVKSLAKKMRRLATEIGAIECNNFIAILNHKETAKWHAETGLGPEDVDDLSLSFPFLALPKWLEKRASMYEEWSQLSSQKIPPKDLGLARVARVCLTMYVKYATGKTYFPQVTTLLECSGLGRCSAAQLSRELKEFESGYSWSYGYLNSQFHLLHPPDLDTGKLHVGGIPD